MVKTQLDFAALKIAIGCPSNSDILEFADSFPSESERTQAHQIILRHELDDAATSTWIPGAQCFVEKVKQAELPLAIVTRNCRAATELKIKQNNIPITTVVTREDAPPKPNPEALLMIANEWGIEPAKIAYIGDYKYDIFAAHNANMKAWLYTNPSKTESFADCLQEIHKNNPLFQQ